MLKAAWEADTHCRGLNHVSSFPDHRRAAPVAEPLTPW
ncbi:hypothetical protein Rumeso_01366 [Rubellimicrobium mesophilum DSM 19309]|uniref:Uncharacterized protein n=1 Tax=Rubellimicrobium mesophilum DSM 19309 TaxID=442562 RepID=A0A017HRK3_9RHOB|nr:hypothetical protein Rumeso_01366 [Rubellimicrobium mesophilum DSM 19309]